MKTIIGRKIGMTRKFKQNGDAVAVTVVEAGPCVILQKKTTEKEGYNALQIGYQDNKENKTSKPLLGLFKKNGLTPKKIIKEIEVSDPGIFEIGQELKADNFEVGEKVSATGVSIGKGFQGAIKRWNFHRGKMTHGSKNHRNPGAIGAGTGRSNVFKGKKMPGHMGNVQCTIANLEILEVISDKNLMLISGAIPGPKNGLVVISNLSAEYTTEKLGINKIEETPVSPAENKPEEVSAPANVEPTEEAPVPPVEAASPASKEGNKEEQKE